MRKRKKDDDKNVNDSLKVVDDVVKKLVDYSTVLADNDQWWFRVMVELGNEGKITRQEVFAIAEDAKRYDKDNEDRID